MAKTSYKQYQNMLDNINVKKDSINKKKLDYAHLIGEINLVKQKNENLLEKLSNLKNLEKNFIKESDSLQNLETLSDIIESFRSYLISRVRPALSSYASDFFERLTDGKYHEIEIDENYNLKVYENNSLFGIERFSGGEIDLANLCLRLAISEIITARSGGIFNFIILDEIFGSQDSIRRKNILEALNGLSSKFRQIFLITHIDDLKIYMENIISIYENDNGLSSIKLN
jgi:exonuclease SbcC